jgi:hypothetical protein
MTTFDELMMVPPPPTRRYPFLYQRPIQFIFTHEEQLPKAILENSAHASRLERFACPEQQKRKPAAKMSVLNFLTAKERN